MRPPVILRIFKNSQLVEVKLFESEQIVIGHEGDVQVDLNDSAVAPIHCLIELRDSGFYLCDLGSQSGTYKNGQAILDVPISSGDQITVGPFTIHFFVGVPKPMAPPPSMTNAPPAAAPPKAPPPGATPSLRVVSDSGPAAPPKIPGAARKEAPKKDKKNLKTFAPPSEIQDLKQYLKPTKGPVLEVIVAWRERIIESYHFTKIKKGMLKIGSGAGADVVVPSNVANKLAPFIELGTTCKVIVPATMDFEVVTSHQVLGADDVIRSGRATMGTAGHLVRLDQGEIICVQTKDGLIQIYIRYVSQAPVPVLASPLDLSSSELTGMVVSLVLVALLALYMSVYQPPEKEEEKEEEPPRLAQLVMNTPTPTPTPTPEPTPKPPVSTPPPPSTPKPTPQPTPKKVIVKEATPTPTPQEKKVVKVTDKDKPAVAKSNANNSPRPNPDPSKQAADVRPNNNKNAPKKFTSTKQGGSVKLGKTESANAQSANVDPTKTGLLSAFGAGGMRSKLDTAYSGSGEMLGTANAATGTSGQASDRAGDDIGSKFKDTGAGGKGTATQGIAGGFTKGRGGGQSGYGSGGTGMGTKGNVTIEAGGADASFEGTIDREAVRRVIRSIHSQIKSCYERGLRTNSALAGKVMIQFRIVEQGRVTVSKASSSTLGNREVEECVAARIKEQRFPDPPPGTEALVEYPFVFDAQK